MIDIVKLRPILAGYKAYFPSHWEDEKYKWEAIKHFQDHWNIEAEFGFGYIYTHYDVYPCARCGTKIAKDRSHNYVGPTKAAINLVYTF